MYTCPHLKVHYIQDRVCIVYKRITYTVFLPRHLDHYHSLSTIPVAQLHQIPDTFNIYSSIWFVKVWEDKSIFNRADLTKLVLLQYIELTPLSISICLSSSVKWNHLCIKWKYSRFRPCWWLLCIMIYNRTQCSLQIRVLEWLGKFGLFGFNSTTN